MGIQRRELLAGAGIVTASLSGCSRVRTTERTSGAAELTVGVTTSTYDSGLLDEFHAAFESRYGVTVQAISGGTGETIAHGERGDVDVVMAHARSLEDEFIRSGNGINRRDFAFSDFIVAGPPDDPAGITAATTAREAFVRIAETEAPFCSRGDSSGTHVKEMELWDATGKPPTGEWYLEAGQGMGETLVQADQYGAYLLTVRGNYIDMRDDLDLERFVEGPVTGGDPALDNPYGVIVVNPAKHPSVEYELAMLYTGFLTGTEGQEIIDEYAIDGEQLFYPDGLFEEPNFEQYVPLNKD